MCTHCERGVIVYCPEIVFLKVSYVFRLPSFVRTNLNFFFSFSELVSLIISSYNITQYNVYCYVVAFGYLLFRKGFYFYYTTFQYYMSGKNIRLYIVVGQSSADHECFFFLIVLLRTVYYYIILLCTENTM